MTPLIKNNTVFVVMANKVYSDHSYFVGVYSKKAQAIKAANTEESFRGGKYECEIIKHELNKQPQL